MKTLIRLLAITLTLASAACSQSPGGSSFDFDYHGGGTERALYEY